MVNIKECAVHTTTPMTLAEREHMMLQVMEGVAIPAFVIDRDHVVAYWNRALEMLTGVPASQVVGTKNPWQGFYDESRPLLANLVLDGLVDEGIIKHYGKQGWRSRLVEGAFEAEGTITGGGRKEVWLHVTAAPLHDRAGRVIGAVETIQDISEKKRTEDELNRYRHDLEALIDARNAELTRASQELRSSSAKLDEAHHQLVQSEKMASIGQLAAGVAHEINNPIGFVNSNLGTLETYVHNILRMLDVYQQHEDVLAKDASCRERLQRTRQELDLDFLKDDVMSLLAESRDGLNRVKKIVQDLKEFSHVGEGEWQFVDLHQGLDSTLNIVNNELKYKAKVIKAYGDLPEIECLPTELNQVFMNLLVNAGHAIVDKGTISVATGCEGSEVWVEFSDTGRGIPPEHLTRVFDPFFTTKPVGKGTGLGLALSYNMIKKHHGRIDVASKVGEGTTFRITLPLRQPESHA